MNSRSAFVMASSLAIGLAAFSLVIDPGKIVETQPSVTVRCIVTDLRWVESYLDQKHHSKANGTPGKHL